MKGGFKSYAHYHHILFRGQNNSSSKGSFNANVHSKGNFSNFILKDTEKSKQTLKEFCKQNCTLYQNAQLKML